MKRTGKSSRLGTLLFLIPIILVVALVAYAIIDTIAFQNGTLIVEAQTSAKYYPAQALYLPVSVSGRAGTTPYTLSLPAGTYTVNFQSEHWFVSPPSRTVNLPGGRTSYIVGTYDPIPVIVSVDQSHFNTTSIEVMHGITPVVWVNPSSNYEVISSSLTGRLFVAPLQNFTYVFSSQGKFAFSFAGNTSPDLVVTVV
jgi:hypothetical protein